MPYSEEAAAEVRRLAHEHLRWEPSEDQVGRIIALADTNAHLAAIMGRVYRSRFSPVGVGV